MNTALSTPLLALPEPSWHTCIPATPHLDIHAWGKFCDELVKLSSPALVDLSTEHARWEKFAGHWSYSHDCSGLFTLKENQARCASAREVQDAINREMIRRFKATVFNARAKRRSKKLRA